MPLLDTPSTQYDVISILGDKARIVRQKDGTYELIIQLAHGGTEIDPRQIRVLTTGDEVTIKQPSPVESFKVIQPDPTLLKVEVYTPPRTQVLVAWSLTTTSTSADQSIGTRNVSTGKKWRILAVIIEVYYTTLSTTAAYLGLISVRIGGSTWIGALQASNTASGALFGVVIPIPEGQEVDAGVVIDAVCTPASVTSTVWKVNIIGFER